MCVCVGVTPDTPPAHPSLTQHGYSHQPAASVIDGLPIYLFFCCDEAVGSGHFDMWTVGGGIRTANPSITGLPTLPSDLIFNFGTDL